MNDHGTFQQDFDDSFDRIRRQFFSVKQKQEMQEESRLSCGKGILWVRDLSLNKAADGVALVCDGIIV